MNRYQNRIKKTTQSLQISTDKARETEEKNRVEIIAAQKFYQIVLSVLSGG